MADATEVDLCRASPSTGSQKDIHYASPDVSGRIHIMGAGGVGKLLAHSIRGIPRPPPVTIIFHRPSQYDEFKEANNTLSLTTGKNTETRGGYEAEIVFPGRPTSHKFFDHEAVNNHELISYLILSVKAPHVVGALRGIAKRLTPASTILFLQNGMGIIDEVNEKVFPDPERRPNYMQGVNSHGLHSQGVCAATHAGQGTLMLGILPRTTTTADNSGYGRSSDKTEVGPEWVAGPRYLLRTLSRTPVLAAVGLSPSDLLQAQLEKLAVNCLINPLSVMFDCRNGDLLYNFAISRTMYLLLAEISLVIRSLPELRGLSNVPLRFSPERLEYSVRRINEKTAENISSMLQDARRGTKTEIDYLNGYIVKRGEELGIKAVMNYMLMQMVIGKEQMISKEIDNKTPISSSNA